MACPCGGLTTSNTGTPGCKNIRDVTARDYLVNLVADDGTKNSIPAGQAVNEAYITARTNDTDRSKRWYPLPEYKNVEGERAAPEKETFNDGTSVPTRDGVRNHSALIINEDHSWYAEIVGFKCSTNLGVLKISRSEQIIGKLETDGDITPVPMQPKSFVPLLIEGTDSAVPKVQISYEYASHFKDEQFGMITKEDIAEDAHGLLLTINGLMTAHMKVVGTPSTSEVVIDMYTKFGSARTGEPIKGLTIADFDVYNETDSASTVPTSVTESTSIPGRYTFEGPFTPVLTSADELEVTLDSTVTGYDDSVMATVDITIA